MKNLVLAIILVMVSSSVCSAWTHQQLQQQAVNEAQASSIAWSKELRRCERETFKEYSETDGGIPANVNIDKLKEGIHIECRKLVDAEFGN